MRFEKAKSTNQSIIQVQISYNDGIEVLARAYDRLVGAGIDMDGVWKATCIFKEGIKLSASVEKKLRKLQDRRHEIKHIGIAETDTDSNRRPSVSENIQFPKGELSSPEWKSFALQMYEKCKELEREQDAKMTSIALDFTEESVYFRDPKVVRRRLAFAGDEITTPAVLEDQKAKAQKRQQRKEIQKKKLREQEDVWKALKRSGIVYGGQKKLTKKDLIAFLQIQGRSDQLKRFKLSELLTACRQAIDVGQTKAKQAEGPTAGVQSISV